MGQFGGFTGKGVKTIVPGRATAKLACRLVPDQDPHQVLEVQSCHSYDLSLIAAKIRNTSLRLSTEGIEGSLSRGCPQREQSLQTKPFQISS